MAVERRTWLYCGARCELFAVGLHFGELRGVFGELPIEAVFLQREIAEVFAVCAVDEGVERRSAVLGILFMGAFGGELVAAESIKTGFEGGDAQQTPVGIGREWRPKGQPETVQVHDFAKQKESPMEFTIWGKMRAGSGSEPIMTRPRLPLRVSGDGGI